MVAAKSRKKNCEECWNLQQNKKAGSKRPESVKGKNRKVHHHQYWPWGVPTSSTAVPHPPWPVTPGVTFNFGSRGEWSPCPTNNSRMPVGSLCYMNSTTGVLFF